MQRLSHNQETTEASLRTSTPGHWAVCRFQHIISNAGGVGCCHA